MAELQHILLLLFRDTSPNDLIIAIFEQVWLIPKILPGDGDESSFRLRVQISWYDAICKIVYYVCVPWILGSYSHQLFIWKVLVYWYELGTSFSSLFFHLSRKVVSYHILTALLIPDLQIKFLQ